MVLALRNTFLAGIWLVAANCSAFIYEVKVLKKWQPELRRYHYFVGCSDFHDKRHDATSSQITAIKELLKEIPREESMIIVEDLSTENNCGRKSCGKFFLNSKGGILGGLTQTCQSCNVPVANLEFRYCRVIALGQLLHNLKADPHSITSLKSIRIKDVIEEIQATIDEIKKYEDGKDVAAWYIQTIKDVEPHVDKLHAKNYDGATMADYIERNTTHKTMLKILKYLLTFDSTLLDVKMVHSVLAAENKRCIYAFAGGTHITRVADMLKGMGYKEVYSTKSQYFRERDLEKCLGSHITDGAYCMRPHPISQDVLKKIAHPDSL